MQILYKIIPKYKERKKERKNTDYINIDRKERKNSE